MNESQINRIVERVVDRLRSDVGNARPGYVSAPRHQGHAGHGVFETVDEAIAAAESAFAAFMDFPLSGVLNPQKFSLRQDGAVLA